MGTQELTTTTGLRLGFVDLSPAELGSLDTDKLQALLDMKRSEEDRAAEREFNAALVKFRQEVPALAKTAEGAHGAKYAPWDEVDSVITPILASAGLALTFGSPRVADGRISLTGILRHSGGHSEADVCEMPVDQSLRANDSQKAGSAISYAKRYLAGCLLNLSYGEDDDGEAGGTPTISQEEADKIRESLDQIRDRDALRRFWGWLRVEQPEDIPASKLGDVREALTRILSKQDAS